MSLDSFKLSEKAKSQLTTLKRKTKVEHWNVLCRWAFCLSLSEKSKPPEEHIPSDSNVEMTWKVFAGLHSETYLALLRQRAHNDGVTLNESNSLDYFRLHLHRGISYLTNQSNIKNIQDLLSLAVKA